MEKFDSVRTKITAPHITTAVSILVVTAKAEQIPSTCSAMGLFLKERIEQYFFRRCCHQNSLLLLA